MKNLIFILTTVFAISSFAQMTKQTEEFDCPPNDSSCNNNDKPPHGDRTQVAAQVMQPGFVCEACEAFEMTRKPIKTWSDIDRVKSGATGATQTAPSNSDKTDKKQ